MGEPRFFQQNKLKVFAKDFKIFDFLPPSKYTFLMARGHGNILIQIIQIFQPAKEAAVTHPALCPT